MNLSEKVPGISHEQFSQALAAAFRQKWRDRSLNERLLSVQELRQIPKLMEIYEGLNRWEWRFGETPQFSHALEKKFEWALLDVEFDVQRGRIAAGKVYSDCLVPQFIDVLNEILGSGVIAYDMQGVDDLGNRLVARFSDNA